MSLGSDAANKGWEEFRCHAVDPQCARPRHGDVEHRAQEQEDRNYQQAAYHGGILRRCFAPPAAFGTAVKRIAAQVVAAGEAQPALAADVAAQGERAADERPENGGVEACVDGEAGPDGAKGKQAKRAAAEPGRPIKAHR